MLFACPPPFSWLISLVFLALLIACDGLRLGLTGERSLPFSSRIQDTSTKPASTKNQRDETRHLKTLSLLLVASNPARLFRDILGRQLFARIATRFGLRPIVSQKVHLSDDSIIESSAQSINSMVSIGRSTLEDQMLHAPKKYIKADGFFKQAVDLCIAQRNASASTQGQMKKVLELLRLTFELDFKRLHSKSTDRQVTNVTCLQPSAGAIDGGYGVYGEDLLQLPLRPGRHCVGAACCESCSRVEHPDFANIEECRILLRFLANASDDAKEIEKVESIAGTASSGDIESTLTMIRLIERMRRAVAYEYGLPLHGLLPVVSSVHSIQGVSTRSGGLYDGIHSDQSSIGVHYSGVLYLSAQHQDFEGGDFVYCDKTAVGDMIRTRISPEVGKGIYFSSGWENKHYVETVTSGQRAALTLFFTTVGNEPQEDVDGVPLESLSEADFFRQNVLKATSEEDVRLLPSLWHRLFA